MQNDPATPSGAAASPVVSVIIPTYNRSRTLRHAIQSVCDSTFTNWELIVVGDACTDDTAECVSSFNDPRIRFINLPGRCGDQSGPNNHGIASSRGRYIAFLNHDDLYFPDHLSACLTEIESSGADLVWVPCAVANATPALSGNRPFSFGLQGVVATPDYSPMGIYFASSWVLRRSLAERVGPWRPPEKCFVTPSQDWLFRAWRMGAKLRFLPSVTVIVVPAGGREGSYARRSSPDHDLLTEWLTQDPRSRERILEEAAINEAMGRFLHRRHPPLWPLVRRMLLRPIYFLLPRIGIHPHSLRLALVYGRRGAFIRYHRRFTGAE